MLRSRSLIPSTRPVQVGIVGAGLMGYWHARSAQRLGATILGIADPSESRAAALAHKLGIGTFVASASELFRDFELDAVHICAPSEFHFGLIEQALDSGIHALVEKPLARSAQQTKAVAELAVRKNLVLCPVHQMMFQKGVRKAASLLPNLGRVVVIEISMFTAGGTGRPEANLDALLADVLPHPLSLMLALWPKSTLRPQDWIVRRPRAGEMIIAGEHAGAVLSILVSSHARPTCFEMEISCEDGALRLDLFHGYVIRRGGEVSRYRKVLRPFADPMLQFGQVSVNLLDRGLRGETAYPGLRALIGQFYAAVKGEGSFPIRLEEAIAVAAARDEVLRGLCAVGGSVVASEIV